MDIVERIRAKLYREAKYLGRELSYALGFNRHFYRNARGSRILIYHGICRDDHTRFNPIFLTQEIFESHLKLYRKYFNVVSLDDFYAQRFSNDRFNICITFDDGFANNHKYVLPLLAKYSLPATFFITAIRDAGYDVLWNDFLGIVSKYGPASLTYKDERYRKDRYKKYCSVKTGERLSDQLRATGFAEKAAMMDTLYPLVPFRKNFREKDYWLQMTTTEIRELAASPFVDIGAHGYYHNDLSRLNITEALDEMDKSKQFLENVTGKPVRSFAFPYGAYTRELIDTAKAAGYHQLLAMDFSFAEDAGDPALRERFTVNPFITPLNQMYATITRRYER